MKSGTAAGDGDLTEPLEPLGGDRAELGTEMHVAGIVDTPAQRLFDDLRLLEDLFEHEMLETALFGRARVPGDRDGLSLDARPGIVGQTKSVTPHDGDFALLQNDLAPRVRQNRR